MIITLTTDFGLSDPFVGTMKGVIGGIAPAATVVDITHDIDSYDVMDAAFVIGTAVRFFPPGTIHVVVVDPGVGTSRRPVAVESQGQVFIAPDNGVLSYVLNGPDRAAGHAAYHITNRTLFNPEVSRTFHGRDIFAPVAAHLARGAPIAAVGPRIEDLVQKNIPSPRRTANNRLSASVLRVDKFGNVITNLRPQHLEEGFVIRISGHEIRRRAASYAEVEPGSLFVIEDSSGYVEIALNRDSAARKLHVARGSEFELETGGLNQ